LFNDFNGSYHDSLFVRYGALEGRDGMSGKSMSSGKAADDMHGWIDANKAYWALMELGKHYSTPIWHGKWRIYVSANPMPLGAAFRFTHDDFDGGAENDNRCGYGATVEDCKREINERNG
jgi:hypothetical protein